MARICRRAGAKLRDHCMIVRRSLGELSRFARDNEVNYLISLVGGCHFSFANIFLNTKSWAWPIVTCTIKSHTSKSDIEHLAEGLERCRKAMLLSKVAIAGGAICILAYFLGVISFDPTIVIGALAAIIGGVVVFGSNPSTSKQIVAAIKTAETQRAKLIDMIDFRGVGASRGGGL